MLIQKKHSDLLPFNRLTLLNGCPENFEHVQLINFSLICPALLFPLVELCLDLIDVLVEPPMLYTYRLHSESRRMFHHSQPSILEKNLQRSEIIQLLHILNIFLQYNREIIHCNLSVSLKIWPDVGNQFFLWPLTRA